MITELKLPIEENGTIFMITILFFAILIIMAFVLFMVNHQILYAIITFGSFWLLIELLTLFLRVLGIKEIKTRWD